MASEVNADTVRTELNCRIPVGVGRVGELVKVKNPHIFGVGSVVSKKHSRGR